MVGPLESSVWHHPLQFCSSENCRFTARFALLWVCLILTLCPTSTLRPLLSIFDRYAWFPTQKNISDSETKEQMTIDLIRDLLDRNEVFPDLITLWPGTNVVEVCQKLITSFDTNVEAIPPGFAYFLLKDLLDMTITRRVDRAARYISTLKVEKFLQTWLSILHWSSSGTPFLSYTPAVSILDLVLDKVDVSIEYWKIKGLNLDRSDKIVPNEPDKKKL